VVLIQIENFVLFELYRGIEFFGLVDFGVRLFQWKLSYLLLPFINLCAVACIYLLLPCIHLLHHSSPPYLMFHVQPVVFGVSFLQFQILVFQVSFAMFR